jgi:hypothetical protein
VPRGKYKPRSAEPEGSRREGRASKTWTDAELAIIRDNPHLSTRDLMARLPGRTPQAVGNKRKHFSTDPQKCQEELHHEPMVREPGEYIETLSVYFMQHAEYMEIWLRWNGYITYRELCRDMGVGVFGIATILCEAK